MNFWRANGGGLVGKGCVGQVSSPGISLGGTGRSSMGHSGAPETRSKTQTNPCLLTCATTSTVLPVVLDLQQFRRGGIVVVPNVVVDHLEVPQPFAGAGIEGEQRIGEQVGALAVHSIELTKIMIVFLVLLLAGMAYFLT